MFRPFQHLLLLSLVAGGGGARAGDLSFNRDIRPILSDKCFKCHGPDAKNQKSDFRLDTSENALRDLGGYAGVVPGKLEKSEVHWRIRSDDPDDLMPPPESKMNLTAGEKDLLDRWIREGAPYEAHWSLVPLPDQIEIPRHAGTDWARNEIDHFIAGQHAAQGLAPSSETTAGRWLRRVTFDLTGLPPTPQELDAFLAAPDHEAAVDRLLDSDAYAERMTSEWLDVARYSDTFGYQVDRNRDVWPWRDWVIRAFRENLSYDRFITRQVAGDLLPDATPDQILATTFNRLHPQKVEGGSVPEEFRVEYVSDRVHTFGTAFLGLTLECTRCHDHKYDPLTQKDYYSLSAFFANIDESGLYAFFTPSVPTPTLALPTGQQQGELAAASRAVAEEEAKLAALRDSRATGPDLVPLAGPIVHLGFEKLEGGKLANAAAPDQPAKTSANNRLVPGKIGRGIHLTGDDAVTLPKGSGNFTRNQPFTVSLWLQTPNLKERAVVVRRSKAWDDAGSRGYELLIEDGRLSAALIHFWPGNALRIRTADTVPPGAWHHLTVTYDGSSRADGLAIYLNGQRAPTEVVRDNLTREITGGGDDFIALGERMRDKGFKNGLVDEFLVWDRELGAAEIPALTQVAAARPLPSPPMASPAWMAQLAAVRAARERRSRAQQAMRQIMVMREMDTLHPTHILDRGLYSEPRERVHPATPDQLPPMPPGAPPNRLGLARWLTHPNHPLTARVTVNRYWQMIFGQGLVSTPEDFGSQGKPPTHPDLLDWLARDFIDHGWDLHHLLRRMVLSATYRQDSSVTPQLREADPENLWLARGPSYRLPAEMIRDQALAVSGLLSPRVGGPSVKPYDLAVSFKPIKPDQGEGLYRRSLYTFWKQTAPAPVMMTLDASKRDVCRVNRERTASPLQSLVLLNSPQFVEAARATAEGLLSRCGSDHAQLLHEAFRLLTSRDPDARELEILTKLWEEQRQAFQATPDDAARYLATGARPPAKDLPPADLAAATVLVSTLMNFDESFSKR